MHSVNGVKLKYLKTIILHISLKNTELYMFKQIYTFIPYNEFEIIVLLIWLFISGSKITLKSDEKTISDHLF